MMSKIPLKLSEQNREKQILRDGIVAELDAVSLYEQMADSTPKKDVKAILLDIAKEEKTHAEEFLTMLYMYDKQQEEEIKRGAEEVRKVI